ncbi:MBL fold metallo-hydrolase [Streptomyces pathocidini]|uniref:MBL fold metallo-hydrolase n=1 Tax=Streptomyces pathocidini TaxID=1650571 RepID=UPI0033D48E12
MTETVEVAAGIHLVHGSDTNWVMVTEGSAVTLVDSGYPRDRAQLLRALAEIGRWPEDVAAVLLTHAHSDHLGSAEFLHRTYGTPVLAHAREVPHARREFLHQVSLGRVLANAWRPGVLPWAVRALRAGGKSETPVSKPRSLPGEAGPLDLPGRPVPVATPGHTDGHCAFFLPQAGVLVTGDALMTAHPTAPRRGPQLLPAMFDTDRAMALESLSALERLDADVLLPGHGPVHRGSAREAVATARERA